MNRALTFGAMEKGVKFSCKVKVFDLQRVHLSSNWDISDPNWERVFLDPNVKGAAPFGTYALREHMSVTTSDHVGNVGTRGPKKPDKQQL